jgi:alpha-tubulin suppressor-like RCC1 family protein
MIGTYNLITKLNTLIESGTLSSLELAQVSAAVESITKNGVVSVDTFAQLPSAVENIGRFFYNKQETSYYFSDGVDWQRTNIFTKSPVNISVLTGSGDGVSDVTTTISDWKFVNASFAGIRSNGRGYIWGGGGTPTLVDSNITWKTIQNGQCGIRTDGVAIFWGSGSWGENGTNNRNIINGPTSSSVVGGITDWKKVQKNGQWSFGIRTSGELLVWGRSAYGNIGYGSHRSSPENSLNINDCVDATSAGFVGAAIRADGRIWTWGAYWSGALGDGGARTTHRGYAGAVAGGQTGFISVRGGNSTFMALNANGSLWGWGSGDSGKLGRGDTDAGSNSPVSVVGGITDWVSFDVGSRHVAAVRANGTLWTWGGNQYGQAGRPGGPNVSSPVQISKNLTDWINVSTLGGNSTIGLRSR